ncbi:coat protein, partial [Drakaea virus A]
SEVVPGGHYDPSVWRNKVRKMFVDQDWWIEHDTYYQMLSQLRAINFEVNTSRAEVARIINAADKDLPANAGSRFPASRQPLGHIGYKPMIYVRIAGVHKQHFEQLARVADQGKSRDIELSRNRTPVIEVHSNNNNAAKAGIVRDEQPMRDGALNYSYIFGNISGTHFPTYEREDFEEEFGLNWNVNILPPAVDP